VLWSFHHLSFVSTAGRLYEQATQHAPDELRSLPAPDLRACVELLWKILDVVLQQPAKAKFRRLNMHKGTAH
jgi:hypothetical protein